MLTARIRVPAMALAVLTIIIISGACSSSAPATPAAILASTAPTAIATTVPTATPAPTAPPTPEATPSPTPEPTPACSAAFTGTPTVGQKVLFSGRGFSPGTYVVVTFNGPTMSNFTFDPNQKQGGVKLLKVKPAGTFGPWDVTFEKADAGDWTLAFSDDTCTATVPLTVTAS